MKTDGTDLFLIILKVRCGRSVHGNVFKGGGLAITVTRTIVRNRTYPITELLSHILSLYVVCIRFVV